MTAVAPPLLTGAQAKNHALRTAVAALAEVGDWQGPVTDMVGREGTTERHGQWLARHGGHREKWLFWACVARLGLEQDLADGYTAGADKARGLVAVYTAAAIHAPASVWLVVTGRHEQWHEPAERTEDDVPIDEDGDPIDLVAGPFPTEDAAADHCVTHDLDDRDFSIVPRLPWSAEV